MSSSSFLYTRRADHFAQSVLLRCERLMPMTASVDFGFLLLMPLKTVNQLIDKIIRTRALILWVVSVHRRRFLRSKQCPGPVCGKRVCLAVLLLSRREEIVSFEGRPRRRYQVVRPECRACRRRNDMSSVGTWNWDWSAPLRAD